MHQKGSKLLLATAAENICLGSHRLNVWCSTSKVEPLNRMGGGRLDASFPQAVHLVAWSEVEAFGLCGMGRGGWQGLRKQHLMLMELRGRSLKQHLVLMELR